MQQAPKPTQPSLEKGYEDSYNSKPTPPKRTQPPPTVSIPKPVPNPVPNETPPNTTPDIEEILKGKTPSKGPTPMPVFGPVPKLTPKERMLERRALREKQKANPNPVVPSKKDKEAENYAMKSGGVAKYAKGGKIDGCARKGKTKGRMV